MKCPVDGSQQEQPQRLEGVVVRVGSQKVSQAMLAYGIGVSKGFIGMAESPRYDIKYNVNHINEIAKFLGCSPRDFLPEKPL